MSDKYILAIDHGTSGAKTALISVRGEIVDFEFEPTPIYFSPGGGAEQSPAEWWDAIIKTSQRLVAKGTVPVDAIEAVCCSSTFSSTVAVDSSGEPLRNSMTWMDSRGAPHVKEAMSGTINVMGYSVSNAVSWISKCGGAPGLSGKEDIAHVLYMKNELPELYAKTHMFLGSKDYLNFRFTGKYAATYDSITLFWITDNRDINNVKYDPRLIKRLGLDASKFPPLMASTEVLGDIRPEVAEEIGLRKNVKVIAGSPDLQSACVGSGAVEDFQAHLYVGTSSWILCHVPFKKTDIFHIIAALPSAVPGRYFCANEQDMAGGCLDYIIDNILFDPNGPAGTPRPMDAYERVEKAATSAPPGSGGLVFTPWLNGEKTPVEDHFLRGGFFNMSTTTDSSRMARSVMEGVAMNSRWVLGHLEKFIGRRIDNINMIGGGAKSPTWRQIFADVLDRNIRCVKDPIQANARGAAFIASVALGHISFDDVPKLVEFSAHAKPNPENRTVYDSLYGEFLNIYKKNRRIFQRLNSSDL